MGVSTDWPKGVVPLRKHASRVYWQEVNGNDHSYFDGGITEINELLQRYAEIEIPSHRVILRAGRPCAMSFSGQATSYAVEFHLPSGLYLFHARRNAGTGLYRIMPQLIVNLDERLIDDLAQLKIPANVELHAHAYPIERLFIAAEGSNDSNRARAIGLLAEEGIDSERAMAVISDAATSENSHVANAARRLSSSLRLAPK